MDLADRDWRVIARRTPSVFVEQPAAGVERNFGKGRRADVAVPFKSENDVSMREDALPSQSSEDSSRTEP